jgi:predicted TIM-barrel fold metal-dependent hydrolase
MSRYYGRYLKLIVDMYCHMLPMKLISSYIKRRMPFLLKFVQGTVGGEDLRFVDPEFRIRYMDKFGISIEVLTMPYNSVWETVEEDAAIKLARILNDAMAEIQHMYPDRFVATATFPSLRGEALDELDRCISELNLKGVLTFTNLNGKPLDNPEFMPFYDKMTKFDLPIWIHPVH